MPPKNKTSGKKGKGKTRTSTVSSKNATSEPTEKELILQAELESVTQEYEAAKERVDKLRADNEWLQQEAQTIRIETHEYMGYMEKKLSKRQTTIVTLSDHNKQEIENIEQQKKNIENEFDDKSNKLKTTILEKQHALEKVKLELENLTELKTLQKTQANRIADLENQISQKREENSARVQELKETFLHEKKKCQQESDERIQTLKNEANKEALKCLIEHTNHIKAENRELRAKLTQLIKSTNALHAQRDKLDQQKSQLLKEQQYTEDMKLLRNKKLHKILSSEEPS